MRYRYLTADVFTDRVFGGNPLAVFPRADGLGDALMQRVAAELGLSETAFVFPPENPSATRRIRIFTPAIELPFAGHPTIGTACVLAAIGELAEGEASGERSERRIVLEENVGPVAVRVRVRPGGGWEAVFQAARNPAPGPPPPADEILAAMLGLDTEELGDGDLRPEAYGAGVPYVLIPVRDRTALGHVRVDLALWERHLRDAWAPHLYVFTRDSGEDEADLRARMFAPAMGIREDPATGAAVTALAGYLGTRASGGDGTHRWVIRQGVEMERPSRLEVEADLRAGRIEAVRVGGRSVLVADAVMEIPLAGSSPLPRP